MKRDKKKLYSYIIMRGKCFQSQLFAESKIIMVGQGLYIVHSTMYIVHSTSNIVDAQ